MFLIILPQAMRIILPPLAVQAANLVKNTSILAFFVGGEIMYFSNSFAGSTSYYGPVYVVAAALYFIICFPLSRLALYLERRTRSRKHVATGDAAEHLAEDPTEVTPGSHDITGYTASDSLAAGVRTMHETVDIAPPIAPPSPRHPLHALADPDDPAAAREARPITGRRAAEIADEIGRELQQQITDECGGDDRCVWRKTHTKAGRVARRGALRGGSSARRGRGLPRRGRIARSRTVRTAARTRCWVVLPQTVRARLRAACPQAMRTAPVRRRIERPMGAETEKGEEE